MSLNMETNTPHTLPISLHGFLVPTRINNCKISFSPGLFKLLIEPPHTQRRLHNFHSMTQLISFSEFCIPFLGFHRAYTRLHSLE